MLTAVITFLVVSLVDPVLFDAALHGSGAGHNRPAWAGVLRERLATDVGWSLLVGGGGTALVASAVGWGFGRHVVRPLEAVQAATHRLAHGDYDVEVPIPVERELADVATDVRKLAEDLAASESRRVRLLGELAHELRTPLTVIDGAVEAMIDGLVSTPPITSRRSVMRWGVSGVWRTTCLHYQRRRKAASALPCPRSISVNASTTRLNAYARRLWTQD